MAVDVFATFIPLWPLFRWSHRQISATPV